MTNILTGGHKRWMDYSSWRSAWTFAAPRDSHGSSLNIATYTLLLSYLGRDEHQRYTGIILWLTLTGLPGDHCYIFYLSVIWVVINEQRSLSIKDIQRSSSSWLSRVFLGHCIATYTLFLSYLWCPVDSCLLVLGFAMDLPLTLFTFNFPF